MRMSPEEVVETRELLAAYLIQAEIREQTETLYAEIVEALS